MKAHLIISCSRINMGFRATRAGVAKESETALVWVDGAQICLEK